MSSGHRSKNVKSSMLDSVYANCEWFITAICVTLVFIFFMMQAYTIPTGSMADTLKGAHFRFRCSQCGFRFDYNFHPTLYGVRENTTPGNNVPVPRRNDSPPRCPSCGYYVNRVETGDMPVMKGDRIFVAKCIYQFVDPKRWDVVVFKTPLEPKINYIKRMMALPGDRFELIDGDVYIDGEISRKPENVQEELWMSVYDNDFRPAHPQSSRFYKYRFSEDQNKQMVVRPGMWRQPFRNAEGSNWDLEKDNPTEFSLSSGGGELNTIVYDTSIGNDFKATYAYDDTRYYGMMPVCSDLMVQFYARRDAGGAIGASVSKYGIVYKGLVDALGGILIGKIDSEGKFVTLAEGHVGEVEAGEFSLFRFSNADHQLVLEFGSEKLVYDLGVGPDGAGQRRVDIKPEVSIIGAGEVTLRHVGIFRDIHYLSYSGDNGRRILRGSEGDAFELGEDEFFVLGDNSPASLDSRWWPNPGIGNNGAEYRVGTVPREYLVGKAFFVYWPGGSKGFGKSLRLVPYVGGLKRIHGG
ncbi:MAG: signal peptidase I [Planctomycetes bacterium]|nr:signal peptidase I [Planctomycetota bacterium]